MMSLTTPLPQHAAVETGSGSHVLQTIQALTNTYPTAPNIQEIANHYAVGVAEASEMVRPHLDSKAVDLIIADGGALLYRTSDAVSAEVRNSLKVAALLPGVGDLIGQQLSRITQQTHAIQGRVTQGQYLSAERGSLSTLLSALGDLCQELAEISEEVEDGLRRERDGETDMAAYLLTRAKATMLGTPL